MSRDKTHWEGCWRVHHECAVAKIERQSEADQRDAARYRAMRAIDLAAPFWTDWAKAHSEADCDAAVDKILPVIRAMSARNDTD